MNESEPGFPKMHEPDSAEAELLRKVTDAALACVARDGFERTTLENIVRESGVARTTIYRNIGGRDQILSAMVARMAQPHHERCQLIAAGGGSWEERLSRVLAMSVANMEDYPWLKELVRQGLSETSIAMFATVSRSLGGNVMRAMLEGQASERGWSPDIAIDELMHWLLRQILYLGGREDDDERSVQRYILTFVLPVFRALDPGEAAENLDLRLARLERDILRHERLLASGAAQRK